ncbi:MAG: Hsp20/alpha crystallin family protein [Anaerolineae bacterium]|jgi:HSP20 family protein|nr:Hsp20/alpha crystallin family protein [Chloroflexota bacterium]
MMDNSIVSRPRRAPFGRHLPGELFSWQHIGLFRDGFLATDMYETESSYVVRSSLPGVERDQLTITRTGDTLTVKGTVSGADDKGGRYLNRELGVGEFSRTLTLPEDAGEDVSATLENGVLVLEFSKPQAQGPVTINVREAK